MQEIIMVLLFVAWIDGVKKKKSSETGIMLKNIKRKPALTERRMPQNI